MNHFTRLRSRSHRARLSVSVLTLALTSTLALIAPSAATAQSADPASVLARARAEYATVRTARAEFTQEIKNPLLGRTLTSRGTLVQRKPGKMSVTFSDPAGDRIVSDGTWLWVYIPSSSPGQVMKLAAGEGGTGGVDVAATVLDAPREGYTLSAAGPRTVNGRATQGVTLTAKAGVAVPFPKATLWIDNADGTVREVAITDETGTSRTIRLVSYEKNVDVDASAFTFKVPGGVKVVQQP